MAAEAPWVRWFASDFLTGVIDLEADERGVYITLLSLMFDRGGPVPDDAAWLARRCGCSTRRFNAIRARLIQMGKMEVRAGQIGNRRALDEVRRRDAKSDQARSAAMERWNRGNEPELELDPPEDKPPIKSRKKGQTTPEQNVLNSAVKSEKREKTATEPDADAPGLAGAREELELELEREDSTTANLNNRARRENLAVDAAVPETDLLGLTQRLTRIGAVAMVNPSSHSMNLDTVKAWLAAGYDVDATIVPTIERRLADTKQDTIGSLNFYSAGIAKAHALASRAAKPKAGPKPLLMVPDEDPRVSPLRRDLLKGLGEWAYVTWLNRVRIEPVQDLAPGDQRRPVRFEAGPQCRNLPNLFDGERRSIITAILNQHGFTEAW